MGQIGHRNTFMSLGFSFPATTSVPFIDVMRSRRISSGVPLASPHVMQELKNDDYLEPPYYGHVVCNTGRTRVFSLQIPRKGYVLCVCKYTAKISSPSLTCFHPEISKIQMSHESSRSTPPFCHCSNPTFLYTR